MKRSAQFRNERRPVRQRGIPRLAAVDEREVFIVKIKPVITIVDHQGHKICHVLTSESWVGQRGGHSPLAGRVGDSGDDHHPRGPQAFHRPRHVGAAVGEVGIERHLNTAAFTGDRRIPERGYVLEEIGVGDSAVDSHASTRRGHPIRHPSADHPVGRVRIGMSRCTDLPHQ